ncbi:MAG: hypothetical protein WAP47_03385 [Candidatus Rokuibacteriota bacterium]
MSLSEEYTDNFNRSDRNRHENFRTSLSPGLTVLINRAPTTGQVTYSLSGSHDSSTDDINLFHSLLGQVSWQADPRLRLTASDVLTRNDEPTLADQLSLRRERQTFTSNTFSLTSEYLIANISTREYYRLATFFNEDGVDTISHTLGAGASTSLYQANTASLGYAYLLSQTSRGSDISGHQVTASLARQLSSMASGGVAGSYAFRTATSSDAARETDFSIWAVSLFSAYAVPNTWSLSASIGFSRLESDHGGDTSSITTMTSFSYRFARATATLSVDQGFSETFAEGENFGVVETRGVRGSLSYPFTPFISGNTSVFYRENEFTGIGGGQADRTEDTWGGSVSFSIQLLRWLNLGLDYTRTEGTSSRRGDFTENRARASLNAGF